MIERLILLKSVKDEQILAAELNNLLPDDLSDIYFYLRVNPDVIPKGYLKLGLYRDKSGRLLGREKDDHQQYDIVKWYDELYFQV